MNTANGLVERIKVGLGIALVAALTGCVGYVDGGYGGTVVVPAPDVYGPEVYVFGGGYERGREAHDYGHRGFESRAAAHPARGGRGGRR